MSLSQRRTPDGRRNAVATRRAEGAQGRVPLLGARRVVFCTGKGNAVQPFECPPANSRRRDQGSEREAEEGRQAADRRGDHEPHLPTDVRLVALRGRCLTRLRDGSDGAHELGPRARGLRAEDGAPARDAARMDALIRGADWAQMAQTAPSPMRCCRKGKQPILLSRKLPSGRCRARTSSLVRRKLWPNFCPSNLI